MSEGVGAVGTAATTAAETRPARPAEGPWEQRAWARRGNAAPRRNDQASEVQSRNSEGHKIERSPSPIPFRVFV